MVSSKQQRTSPRRSSPRKAMYKSASVGLCAASLALCACDHTVAVMDTANAPPLRTVTRSCDSRIEAERLHMTPSGKQDIIAGPVVFFGLKLAASHPPPRMGDKYGAFKTPTQVRVGSDVRLTLEGSSRSWSGLAYDRRNLSHLRVQKPSHQVGATGQQPRSRAVPQTSCAVSCAVFALSLLDERLTVETERARGTHATRPWRLPESAQAFAPT
jgi:hypothetical protein